MLLFAFPLLLIIGTLGQFVIARLVGVKLFSVEVGLGPKIGSMRLLGTNWNFKGIMITASIYPQWVVSQEDLRWSDSVDSDMGDSSLSKQRPRPRKSKEKEESVTPPAVEPLWLPEIQTRYTSLWWRYLFISWAPPMMFALLALILMSALGQWAIYPEVSRDLARVLTFQPVDWSVGNAFETPFLTGLLYLTALMSIFNLLPIIGTATERTLALTLWGPQTIAGQTPTRYSLVILPIVLYVFAAVIYALF